MFMNNQEKPAFNNEISAEQERIIASFEQHKCPECERDEGRSGDTVRYDGFCSKECRDQYEIKDPNLINLKNAEGEFNYRYSLSQDAKKLDMDVAEYRKLREKHLSYADIAKMKGKE